MGLKLNAAVSPTLSCQLSLSFEILEQDLEETVNSDQGTEEEANWPSI